MNLKQLKAFVCVTETGGFSKTDKKLYLTQLTVSAHIQDLEAELGSRLFIRIIKNVVLSGDGKRLYGFARQMPQLEHQILKGFGGRDTRHGDTIAVGASTVPGQHVLLWTLSLFANTYQDYRLDITERDNLEVVERVAQGEFGARFTGTKLSGDNCVLGPFYVDNLIVITPAENRYELYLEIGFPLKQLYHERLVVREEDPGTRKETEEYLRFTSIYPERLSIVVTMSNQETIKKSVSTDMGATIMSEVSVEDYVRQNRVFRLPIREGGLSRRLCMVWNRTGKPGPVTKVFVQLVRDWYGYLQTKSINQNWAWTQGPNRYRIKPMRAKEQRLVVTFHTAIEAMAARKELKLNQIARRLVPAPRQISAGCGLAWSVPTVGGEAVKTRMECCNLVWESMGIYLV